MGDLVWYVLDPEDADEITARRDNFQRYNAGRSGHKHPHPVGGSAATGHVAHIGVRVYAGDVRCAEVTEVADPECGRLNLWVKLDGSDGQWVKGAPEGTGPGTWARRP
jgi:hypothetical protein